MQNSIKQSLHYAPLESGMVRKQVSIDFRQQFSA